MNTKRAIDLENITIVNINNTFSMQVGALGVKIINAESANVCIY